MPGATPRTSITAGPRWGARGGAGPGLPAGPALGWGKEKGGRLWRRGTQLDPGELDAAWAEKRTKTKEREKPLPNQDGSPEAGPSLPPEQVHGAAPRGRWGQKPEVSQGQAGLLKARLGDR